MSQGFIVGKGGGMSKGAVKKPTIVVTYPAGATCTVTGNGKTYPALDTSGAAAFIVEPGTWTVTAVSGERSVSKSVTVSAGGWVEVALIFDTWLYRAGDEFTALTGGFSAINGQLTKETAQLTFKNTDGARFQCYASANAIAKGTAKKLAVNVTSSGGVVRIGASTSRTSDYAQWQAIFSTESKAVGMFDLDLSSGPSDIYLHLGCGVGTGSYTFSVNEIVLQE